MDFRIIEYSPGYESRIIGLISSIQRNEYDIDITPEQQPDLLAIPSFYRTGTGNFWIALAGEVVIGTVALKDIGGGMAALRKMFVARDRRGSQKGVAHALLETALTWARSRRISDIYLGTIAQFKAAHRFYEKNGFVQLPRDALPASFPVMAVDSRFYKYTIHDLDAPEG